VLLDSCDSAGQYLTLTAGGDPNVVELKLFTALSKQASYRGDVRPLLDAARVPCQPRVDEPTRSGVRRGLQLLIVGTARRFVELLGEVVCLEQLDDETVLVDGESATVPLRN